MERVLYNKKYSKKKKKIVLFKNILWDFFPEKIYFQSEYINKCAGSYDSQTR